MGRRKDTPIIIAQKWGMVRARLEGQSSACASTLSASFGLPVEEVRKLLQSKGVRDDG